MSDAVATTDARDVLRAVAHAAPSQPMLVLVGGPPGSGKSRVTRALGARANLIFLNKDAFKEPLMSEFGVRSVEDSTELGRAAMIALFVAGDAVLARHRDVLLESTFTRGDLERISALRGAHRCAVLQVHVTAGVDVLVERWNARAGARHPGHLDEVRLPEMRRRVEAGTWEPLTLDAPLVCIDTSAGDDFDAAAWLEQIRQSPPAATRR